VLVLIDLKQVCSQFRPATESADSVANLQEQIFTIFLIKYPSNLIFLCLLQVNSNLQLNEEQLEDILRISLAILVI
jgi:hypothetical protein